MGGPAKMGGARERGAKDGEGAARLMEWPQGVDIGGIPQGGRLGVLSPPAGVPLWAGKKKRGPARGHVAPRNPEGGLPGGPLRGLVSGPGSSGPGMERPSGGVHGESLDQSYGRLVVRLGGVNDLRGVQFRSVGGVPTQGAPSQDKQGGGTGDTPKAEGVRNPDVQTPGQKRPENVGVQSPGGSCFGVATQPLLGVTKKLEEGGSAGKTEPNSSDKKKIKRIRVIPPREKVGSHPMSPPKMPAPINTPRDRSGGIENTAGEEGGGSGIGGKLEAGESQHTRPAPRDGPQLAASRREGESKPQSIGSRGGPTERPASSWWAAIP